MCAAMFDGSADATPAERGRAVPASSRRRRAARRAAAALAKAERPLMVIGSQALLSQEAERAWPRR
jgi:thiamine pyrophosphate-dependent acetolactate synthase large subunit-like protein